MIVRLDHIGIVARSIVFRVIRFPSMIGRAIPSTKTPVPRTPSAWVTTQPNSEARGEAVSPGDVKCTVGSPSILPSRIVRPGEGSLSVNVESVQPPWRMIAVWIMSRDS